MNFDKGQKLAIPVLMGKSIVLRPCKQSDFEMIKLYRQDPENCRYIRLPEDDTTTHEIVDQQCLPWELAEGRWNALNICFNNGDDVIGEVAFNIECWDNQRAEIGYRLNEQFAGKGVCTEAVKLLVSYLFDKIGLFKIVAKCDPRNIASFKVMEKAGLKKEAYFKQHYRIKDEWTDQLDFGVLRSEWAKLRTQN